MKRLFLLLLFALPLPALADISLFGAPPIFQAISKGDATALRTALMQNANVNLVWNGRTALMDTVIAGREDMAKLLIDHRADVNAADGTGLTALHYAAQNNEPDLIDLLVKAGAKVDPANREGLTPLMTAAREGYPESVSHLLEAGAKKDRLDFTGRSAEDWARDGRNQNVMRLLAGS